jgi:ABC-type amino acid transport substrate-binding protein
VLGVATIGIALAVPAYGQPTGAPAASTTGQMPDLHVAVIIVPPFVMAQNGELTGFSVELWNALAERLKVKTRYLSTGFQH